MADLAALILAAGQGTRMKSNHPKVLHPLLGRPMLRYVTRVAQQVGANPIMIVIGFAGAEVETALGPEFHYIWQQEQLGTGHAVIMAQAALAKCSGDLLVLYGDTPLLQSGTVQQLVDLKRKSKAAAAVLTTKLTDPAGYGRILRNPAGAITAIVESKDASPAEQKICEVNTGVYCFQIDRLLAALKQVSPHNAQGEYYLTDVVKILIEQKQMVAGLLLPDAAEVMGPNDRQQMVKTEKFLQQTINHHWLEQGVTIQDSNQTYVGPEVELGPDTVLLPGTIIYGRTRIGCNCTIGPFTRIIDSTIGDGTEVQFSQVFSAELGSENTVGPFAFVRPGTKTAARVKIGDFVEVKNTQIAAGSKVPHLSYLGDTVVGQEVNIGAGTITCNYDGVKKHPTVIEDGAFIGSNTNLVAPVTVRAGATVAAGSTITKEVPAKALGIARAKQENRTDWTPPRQRSQK